MNTYERKTLTTLKENNFLVRIFSTTTTKQNISENLCGPKNNPGFKNLGFKNNPRFQKRLS